MSRRIISAVLAALCAFATKLPAIAGDQVIYYPQENPPSTQMDQQPRSDRLALGTWMLQALNLTGNGSGIYSNLSTVAAPGLYVIVQPSQSGTLGALYQIAENDPNLLPASCPTGSGCVQLAADNTLIAVQALQNGPTNPIGPLTAPGTGLSVYWLLEAQVQSPDINPQSELFVTSSGSRTYYVVPTTRTKQVVYQIVSGTPEASPTPPATDSGWIPIATVLVASGTTQIDGSMITPAPGFSGFLQSAQAVVLAPSPSPSPQAGYVAVAGTIAATQFFGDGSGLTNLQPSNFSTPVPQSEGGTGTGSPTWLQAGSSNLSVTGSGPNQTVDLAQNPSVTSVTAATTKTATVQSTSSTPVAIPSPGLVVDTLEVEPSAAPTTCPSASACVGGYVYANTGVGTGSVVSTSALALNSGSSDEVQAHYGDGSTVGLSVYDGGTTNKANLSYTNGLTFSGSSTNAYGSSNATVYGNLTLPSGTAGNCLELDSSNHVVTAAGACGLATGTITSVTGSGNISASTSSGAVTVSEIDNPTWTGNPTIASGTTAGTLLFGSDGTANLARTGTDSFVLTSGGGATFEADGGFTAGSSTYGPTSASVNGTVTAGSSSSGFVVGSSTYGPTSASVNGSVTATQFTGSGAGLSTGTIPNAALVTTPVTSVTGSYPIVSSGGATPALSCSACVISVSASGNLSSSGGTTPAISMSSTPTFSSVSTTRMSMDSTDNTICFSAGCTATLDWAQSNTGNFTFSKPVIVSTLGVDPGYPNTNGITYSASAKCGSPSSFPTVILGSLGTPGLAINETGVGICTGSGNITFDSSSWGQLSCSVTGPGTCSTTAQVDDASQCTATYAGNGNPGLATLYPIDISGSSTTLTANMGTSASGSQTLTARYTCL